MTENISHYGGVLVFVGIHLMGLFEGWRAAHLACLAFEREQESAGWGVLMGSHSRKAHGACLWLLDPPLAFLERDNV